jgi:localization factor PodJL
MAITHGTATQGSAKSAAGTREAATTLPYCSADDLKSVLSEIAASIADADRRHTATLSAMQKRLQQLTAEAHDIVSAMPPEQNADALRIGDRMDELSMMVATASEGRGGTTLPQASPAQTKGPLAENAHLFLPGVAAPAKPATPEMSVLADPADPWDDKAVSALADLYATGEAAPKQPPAPIAEPIAVRVPDFVLAAAEAGPPAPQTASLAAVAGSGPIAMPSDRQWLEQRFADIAEKVERSLADLAPGTALTALGQRFDEFEQRFDVAMQGVATRGDLAALNGIEANIAELVTHLEQADNQAARLGAIEAQLNSVAQRLSDENLAELMAAGALTERELDHVATALADRLGGQLQNSIAPQAGGRQADEIRSLIAGFVDDQRQNEEHTATMLDTMQQAMIRLLDRMDQLEQAPAAMRSHTMHSAVPPVRETVEYKLPAAADLAATRPGAVAEPTFTAQKSPSEKPFEPAPAPTTRSFERAAEAATPDATYATRTSGSIEPQVQTPAPDVTDTLRIDPEPELARPQAGGQPRTREDFVAAARRAMRQAASESVDQPGETDFDRIAPAPAPAAPKTKIGKAPKATPAAEKPAGRNLRTTLLVSLAALLTIGGAVAMLSKFRASKGSEAKVERQLVTPQTEQRERAEQGGAGAAEQAPAKRARAPQARGPAEEVETPQLRPEPGTTPRPSLRPKPETMVDELSHNDAVPAESQAGPVLADATPTGSLRGISVQQSSRLPTAEELIRAQRQQRLAVMSNQVGQSQPVAQIMPTALMPENSGAASTTATMPASESAGTQRSDLPPALIGPNSLRLAAAKGDPSAEFEVGARFAEGKGVPQDFKQAVDWYTRSAGRGLAIAQYRLATLYERGLGVKADPGRARAWYGRAAELGNVKAMHNLAVMAASHSQGGPDYASAVRWFTEAADRGLADSQYNLAILHESGLGTPKDPKLAYVWLTLASRGGDKEAMRRRDAIKKSLPADAVKSADEMVAGWSLKPTDLLANEAKAAGEAWKMRHAVQPGG